MRRGVLVCLVALFVLAGVACDPRSVTAPPPGETQRDAFDARMQTPSVVDWPADPLVLGVVLTLPADSAQFPSASIFPNPSASLSRFGRVASTELALARPGLYVSMTDEGDKFVYLGALADPRFSRGEGPALDEPDRSAGRLQSVSGGPEEAVLATRVPFSPGGMLRFFEVGRDPLTGQGMVTDLILEVGLPARRFPDRGWVFRVIP